MKRIIFKEEVCIGCSLCEVHCLVQHSKSKDIIKAYKQEAPKPLSRVRLEVNRPLAFVIQCQHCEDPLCVSACLSGAMQKDEETRLVTHDAEKCIGCWTCIMVCPYGVIKKETAQLRVVAKCDFCTELETPACVTNCPNEALIYKETAF
jgi:carbon-monoxide dehydrogenase iron sulfur subunit